MNNEEQPRCKDAWESKAMELAFALAENYGVTAEATAVHGDALLRHLQTRHAESAATKAAHPASPDEIEAERALFEADAEAMGFDLTRRELAVPEPWSEYRFRDTGHRWAGWLAARSSIRPAQAAEPTPWPKVVITAPPRIWLQVSDDVADLDEPFPAGAEGVTWEQDSVLTCEVPYVRADLAGPQQAAEPVARAAEALFTAWADRQFGPAPDPDIPQAERFVSYFRCFSAALALRAAEERKPLSDEQLAKVAYEGYDSYWTEDSPGQEAGAWAASAKAVLAAHGIKGD